MSVDVEFTHAHMYTLGIQCVEICHKSQEGLGTCDVHIKH